MASLNDLIYQRANLLVDRDLILADIKTQELRAQAGRPGATAELANLRQRLAAVDQQIAVDRPMPSTCVPPLQHRTQWRPTTC